MVDKRTLYLVDASGLIHRAFHAIRALSNSRGMPTNALFGLASMLRKFARENQPEYCAIVFDAGRKTFRNEIYPEYKANRPPADPDLVVQFPYARRLSEAMGFSVLEIEGYEADDIIATLSGQALSGGFHVVVESGDKDLLQLVEDRVAVHDPMKDLVYDREAVIGKMGVPPERVRDLLGLMGDSSDNVPGVAGIGAKGAAELINEHGPLEAIYEHLEELKPGKRKALESGRDAAFLSRKLVTLKTDVPVGVVCEDLKPEKSPGGDLVALLKELEFRSLLEEVVSAGNLRVDESEVQVEEVRCWSEFQEAFSRSGHGDQLALAAVFGSRSPVRPDCRGLAVARSPENAIVIHLESVDDRFLQGLADRMAESSASIANYKEVHQLFDARGVVLAPPDMDPVLAEYVLHPEKESPSLESLSLEVLQTSLPSREERDPMELGRRACAAFRMRGVLGERVREAGLSGLLVEVEIPLARVLSEMERTGVRADRDALREMSVHFGRELQRLEGEIIREAGFPFNPNSPKQLADVLFGKMGLPVVKKTKTGPSTNVTVLEKLAQQRPDVRIPSLILEYRGLAKLKSTYADALASLIHPDTGRIHTSYNQTIAATGRLSSSDPNLQNIPIRTPEGRKIRSTFVCEPGFEFVSADYSQIELRVLAHLSGDQALIDGFRDGIDIHSRTSARIFHCDESAVTVDMRRAAKVINFGLLYGMGAFRLSNDLRISMSEAQSFIEDYFAAFPGVRGYLDGTIEEARKEGFVKTLTGRRRHIEDIGASNRIRRAAAERMATNTPIQGTAADIIKVAMVRLRERLLSEGIEARMVLQVHDELVLETREGQGDRVAEILVEVMEGAYDLAVPLVVEIDRGKAWSELH